jgi:hypothetical protein
LKLSCDGNGFATATFEPKLILGGTSAVQVESHPPSGSRFPLGDTLVTVTATSFSGTQQTTFHVNVLPTTPVLAIQSDGDRVLFTWSVGCSDPILESTDQLTAAGAWKVVTSTPERNGSQASFRLPLPTASSQFFRLHLP